MHQNAIIAPQTPSKIGKGQGRDKERTEGAGESYLTLCLILCGLRGVAVTPSGA